MPRVEKHETRNHVQRPRRQQAHDERGKDLVAEQLPEREPLLRDLVLHALDREEDGGEGQVGHEDGPEVDHAHVQPVAALRPVAERQHEAADQHHDVEELEDDGQGGAGLAQQVLVAEAEGEDAEDEEEVALRRSAAKSRSARG